MNEGRFGDNIGGGKDGEVSLFAGGFKGHCHSCRKQGHKAQDCKDPPKTKKDLETTRITKTQLSVIIAMRRDAS